MTRLTPIFKPILFVFAFVIGSCAPALAQEESTPEKKAKSQDELNIARLKTVFSEVDEFSGINIAIKTGVVQLTGQTLTETDSGAAQKIAASLDGVIYVDNDIEVSTDLSERLTPSVSRFHALLGKAKSLAPLLGIAAGVILVFWLIARLVSFGFFKSPLLVGNRLLHSIVNKCIRVLIVLIGIYLALEIVGATAIVGAILGAAGVAGLALSFAFRDIIENFLASILLSLRQPFRLKDSVDINGAAGKVLRLTSSETVLLSAEGNHIRIPNADVYKGRITNFTRNPMRRFSVIVGVGTDEDLVKAEELGLRTLDELNGILDDPPPSCFIEALGDSSVSIRFDGWIDQSTTDFGKARSHATRLIKTAFDDNGVSMPNPTYEVNLHTVAPEETTTEKPSFPDHGTPVDLSAVTYIDEQIDDEKNQTETEEDLLKPESE
jgi:small conductance mechanosensitive channel